MSVSNSFTQTVYSAAFLNSFVKLRPWNQTTNQAKREDYHEYVNHLVSFGLQIWTTV